MSNPFNPKLFGMRLTMLLYLYRRRLRAHPLQELLAGAGIAVGVALVFGVLLANSNLTRSVEQLIRGLSGSARLALVARSEDGFSEQLTNRVRQLPDVQVATPVLRQNMTVRGPDGSRQVQMIGVSPSLASLGGVAQQELGDGALLLSGGVGLPSGVASSIGARRHTPVTLIGKGYVRSEPVGAVVSGEAVKALEGCPVVVALMPVAQRLTGQTGRISELLVEPRPGADAKVAAELRVLAAGRLDVEPADNELKLLEQATKPNDQATTLFSAISVMVGFLLALNAMLLTVPERRRFIAELRMQGYEPRQILLLLSFQAIVLGLVASLLGVVLGEVLSHTVYQQTPTYLSVAFPISTEETLRIGTVLMALGCGVLATMLASLSPVLDLRPRRPPDAVFREAGPAGGLIDPSTLRRSAVAGIVLLALVGLLTAVEPRLTIFGGVALAVATLCLMPGALAAVARWLPRLTENSHSGAVIVAVSELRAITTRSAALAAIVGIAVYGSVAIGGARSDLLRGIDHAIGEYHSTADVWITDGANVFNTDSFPLDGAVRRLAKVPEVERVRVYQGGLLDVGSRRLWIRARSSADSTMIEASQILRGSPSRTDALLRRGGWAAVTNGFADERHLKLGSVFVLPTPSGSRQLRVAAITTNSGWPPGTITLNSSDYARYWQTSEAAALEVDLRPGVPVASGVHAIKAALASRPGLWVRSSAVRSAEANASARQGLHTLGQILTLLLVAAALAVAAALGATVWQRRARLSSLKIQGYQQRQLWLGLLLESGVMLGVGSALGAVIGVYGHALASHWLTMTTGFPAPFALGVIQVVITLAFITAAALIVIALPGFAAARVAPGVSLQE